MPVGIVEVMCSANAPVTGDARSVGERRHLQQPLIEHVLGAMVALLARLEHEQHTAGDLVPACRQDSGCRRQHRGVRVVTAGVHAAVALRREVEPGVLVERQRIHVAAQQHRRTGFAPGQQRSNARRRLVQGDVERQSVEGFEDEITGDREIIAQFGTLVERSPERHGLRLEVQCLFTQGVKGHARMVCRVHDRGGRRGGRR